MVHYRGTSVKKKLGQNFLVNQQILQNIAYLVSKTDPEFVLEIGAGNGELTEFLAPLCPLSAFEIDANRASNLQTHFQAFDTVSIVEADARKIDYAQYVSPDRRCVVVGNLPYSAATHILKQVSVFRHHIHQIIVMVQKEVAEKLTAVVNNKNYSSMTLYFSYRYRITQAFTVRRDAFYPVPKVDSAVIILEPKTILERKKEKRYDRLVHKVFLNRRKKILNALQKSSFVPQDRDQLREILHSADISPDVRPDQVDLEHYQRLAILLFSQHLDEDRNQ